MVTLVAIARPVLLEWFVILGLVARAKGAMRRRKSFDQKAQTGGKAGMASGVDSNKTRRLLSLSLFLLFSSESKSIFSVTLERQSYKPSEVSNDLISRLGKFGDEISGLLFAEFCENNL